MAVHKLNVSQGQGLQEGVLRELISDDKGEGGRVQEGPNLTAVIFKQSCTVLTRTCTANSLP